MRYITIATYFLVAITVLFFVVFFRLNGNIDKLDTKREEEYMKHLRMRNERVNIMTEEEYYRDEKRFSIVIVTHQEPLLEKTYPIFLRTWCRYPSSERF